MEIETYFQLIHDKQNVNKVRKTYAVQQQKVQVLHDNVDLLFVP